MTAPGEMTAGVVFPGPVMGGLERTVCRLIEILQNAGMCVVALTSRPPEDDFFPLPACGGRETIGGYGTPAARAERPRRLREAVERHRMDVVFLHQYFCPVLAEEIAAVQSAGARAVVHFHNCATTWLAREKGALDVARQFDALRAADAVIALSPANEALFRLLGVRARFIPNPVEDFPADLLRERKTGTADLVWVGRFDASVKRPLDAVRIFERILESRADATLTMLGNGGDAAEKEVTDYLAAHPALRRAVRLTGRQLSPWPFLAKADLALLTSSVEGFPGVVIEAFAAGVPVVGYELPLVDACRDSDAYAAVAQRDVDAAAARARDILSSPDRLRRASAAARAVFERYAAFDQQAAYRELLEDVMSGRDRIAPVVAEARVREAVAGLFAHACVCRNLYVAARKEARSARRSLTARIVRRLKSFFAVAFHRVFDGAK